MTEAIRGGGLDPSARRSYPPPNMEEGFRSWIPVEAGLARAAAVAAREVLAVKQEERALIVTNPDPEVFGIATALYDAIAAEGGRPVIVIQPVKSQLDFTEKAAVAAIASAPEVLISLSVEKLGKDREAIAQPLVHEGRRYDSTFHYLLHGAKRLRSFWSPHVTRSTFVRTVPIDYARLRAESSLLAAILDDVVEVRIAAPAGTDLTIGLRGRRARSDDGFFSVPGAGGNLPAGETFISPELGSARGRIVFDGSMTVHGGDLLLAEPIRAAVEEGFVTRIEGGSEAERLRETIRLGEERALQMERTGTLGRGLGGIYRKNARNLGELGIGLNPKAEITGNMLEDEKAYRTCHIAIGSNYDEDAPSLIHLDGLIREPTITARLAGGEMRTFMRGGELSL